MIKQTELTEEQIDEISAAASGHAAEREFSQHGSATSSLYKKSAPAKSKYIVKHKTTGKVHSVHANAPDAVRARMKAGHADTHSIIKEEIEMNPVKDLINAIESGKSSSISNSFEEVMANKLADAIDGRKAEISASLFAEALDDSVEEAVVPGSVKKDKQGNVLSAKTVPDKVNTPKPTEKK